MGNISKEIKKRLVGEVLSETELENIMSEYRYYPLQDEETEDIAKYTNYSSQIWAKYERDENNYLLITDTVFATKEKGRTTKVEPFHSFEDLNKVLKYFKDNKKYHHWLISCLMISLGRRVGDTMSLKWSDLYTHNGKFKGRLTTLKEEKTGKTVGVRLHEFARECITEYCQLKNINPLQCYNEKIFNIGTDAYRRAVKEAVQEVGIEYPVSTHSFRKFYGNTMYKLHPQDVDSIKMIQFMFGHASEDITRDYIGEIDEKIDRYNQDYSDYLSAKSDGKDFGIDNTPVIVLKTTDLREVLQRAYLMGRENNNEGNDIEIMNQLLAVVDEKRIS